MKTIFLIGPGKCGKTTTMNLVCKKLSSQGKVLKPKIKIKAEMGKGDEEDFRCVIEYKTKTIALFSMGDYYKIVNIEIKVSEKYDILIICCNSRFKNLGKLLMEMDDDFVIVRKKIEHNSSFRNKVDIDCCEKIIKIVDCLTIL